MMDTFKHRGPDDDGAYFFANCTLGHRRLNIIDLVSGDQPMLDDPRKIGLVFNGEIYGYKGISSVFHGFPFQKTSDTEVILALYRRFGRNCLSRLPSMFAFALWDDEEQTLFCARDRFGEKPFYYACGRNGEF
jgi:asparagine synthase (glutamine-hydrolysing)